MSECGYTILYYTIKTYTGSGKWEKWKSGKARWKAGWKRGKSEKEGSRMESRMESEKGVGKRVKKGPSKIRVRSENSKERLQDFRLEKHR